MSETQKARVITPATTEDTAKPESPPTTKRPKMSRQPLKPPCLWGLVSRVQYSITVNLKDGDAFILAPKASTPRQFKEGDVISVENVPLQTAISQGSVAYLR